jgi:hypothetical protein
MLTIRAGSSTLTKCHWTPASKSLDGKIIDDFPKRRYLLRSSWVHRVLRVVQGLGMRGQARGQPQDVVVLGIPALECQMETTGASNYFARDCRLDSWIDVVVWPRIAQIRALLFETLVFQVSLGKWRVIWLISPRRGSKRYSEPWKLFQDFNNLIEIAS